MFLSTTNIQANISDLQANLYALNPYIAQLKIDIEAAISDFTDAKVQISEENYGDAVDSVQNGLNKLQAIDANYVTE